VTYIGLIPTGRINAVKRVLGALKDDNDPRAFELSSAMAEMDFAIEDGDAEAAEAALQRAEYLVRRLSEDASHLS
jgi:hypothetical protein